MALLPKVLLSTTYLLGVEIDVGDHLAREMSLACRPAEGPSRHCTPCFLQFRATFLPIPDPVEPVQ